MADRGGGKRVRGMGDNLGRVAVEGFREIVDAHGPATAKPMSNS